MAGKVLTPNPPPPPPHPTFKVLWICPMAYYTSDFVKHSYAGYPFPQKGSIQNFGVTVVSSENTGQDYTCL